jgi:hypothetical protein
MSVTDQAQEAQNQETLEAIYKSETLRPLASPDAPIGEGQHVKLIVETTTAPGSNLELLLHLYDGLSEEEIDEIEKVILDRRDFFSGRPLR